MNIFLKLFNNIIEHIFLGGKTMYKKSLIILSIFFAVLFISTLSFAAMDGNTVKNAVNSGTNTIVDGAQKLGNSVRNGIGNAENGIEDALTVDDTNNNMNNNDYNNNNNNDNNGNNDNRTMDSSISTDTGYTATRTSDTLATNDMTNIWVWIALAVAAIVLIGVIWYYTTRNNH